METVESISFLMLSSCDPGYLDCLDIRLREIESHCHEFSFNYYFNGFCLDGKKIEALDRFLLHHDGSYCRVSCDPETQYGILKNHFDKQISRSKYVVLLERDVWFSDRTLMNMLCAIGGECRGLSSWLCDMSPSSAIDEITWWYRNPNVFHLGIQVRSSGLMNRIHPDGESMDQTDSLCPYIFPDHSNSQPLSILTREYFCASGRSAYLNLDPFVPVLDVTGLTHWEQVSVGDLNKTLLQFESHLSRSSVPKRIYITYKTVPPSYVFKNWHRLNPSWLIKFSLDSDAECFLEDNFGVHFKTLFRQMPMGMFKADLWRLCRLYIDGGVYSDVDIEPVRSLSTILFKDSVVHATFTSCLSASSGSIFQAFFTTTPRNPLLLSFLYDMINEKSWLYKNGPTYSMYNVIKRHLGRKPEPFRLYRIPIVKILIDVGTDRESFQEIGIRRINLARCLFPQCSRIKVEYDKSRHPGWSFCLWKSETGDYSFTIRGLYRDSPRDWDFNVKLRLDVQYENRIYLFEEKRRQNRFSVYDKGRLILHSRYKNYKNEMFSNSGFK